MKRGRKQDAALTQRIGFRIFKERERRGLTAKVLARRAGLHVNTVYRAEQGHGISVPALVALANAMGLGLDALLANSQYVVGFENVGVAGARKAANVIHGTASLFQEANPVPARPAGWPIRKQS